MASFNQFTMVGRLGKDPVAGQSSTPVAKMSVACTVGYGDKEKTLWMNVTCFSKTAEFAMRLKKGDQILASGYLEPNEWKDKEGVERKEIGMIANTVQALGGGKKADEVPF